jgi:ADP-ribosylglycohydrolase
MKTILLSILVLSGLGALFGAILSFASKIFYVEVDPKVQAVRDCLAGANCGGCGYPGCDGYAAAVAAGMFYDPADMDKGEITRLGMEAVALTHGDPMAFLPGAAVTELVTAALLEPKKDLQTQIDEAMAAFTERFDPEYHRYVSQINNLVKMARSMSRDPSVTPMEAMERLQCKSGAQVLAGVIYALLVGGEDFDASLIAAVNHSGTSAVIGALVGAVLGARLGVEALPEFYLECLECGEILRELADDLFQGCPIETGDVFFDDEWDSKYCHGHR